MFLLFKALSQCETAGVCHGDLKSQNVLISSSNWLQITDFAPFKPCFLTHDNPSAYTFFFDTSRRQSCYIAPERFISATEYEEKWKNGQEEWLFGSLTPAMDMFSAGCIVFELLCDRPPFTYSSLCEYESMSDSDASAMLLKLIQDVPLPYRHLLRLLLNRDPTRRISANAVLTGAALKFPHVLESFLFRYLDRFRPLFGASTTTEPATDDFSQALEFSYLEPDDIISKLKREKQLWWARISENDESKSFAFLFVSLITSNLRALRTIQAKTDAIRMLVELSTISDSTVAIDRILPYFVHLWTDPETQVRATAVTAVAELLAPIQPKTYEESLVFVDYLFPQLNAMSNDSVDCPQHVLFAIAMSLGQFADTAYRFYTVGREIRQATSYEDEVSTTGEAQQNDDAGALLHGVSAMFSALCSKDPMVKRCLVESKSLILLYHFFIKIGNDNTLLRFLCTFLNAKTEWRLRAAFFDSLPVCVQKRSEGMVPLLQLGLQDCEEHVVTRAIGCIHILIKNENLDRFSVQKLLVDVLPFLIHPNDWIRSAVCDILLAINAQWNKAEVHVTLIPLVKPYIEESKQGIVTLRSKSVLMSQLVDPIPRTTFNQILELSLENTKQLTTLIDSEIHFQVGKPFEAQASWFNTIFPKIKTENRTGVVEHNDLKAALEARKRLTLSVHAFRNLFERMAETRNTAGMETFLTRQLGTIDLSATAHSRVRRKEYTYGSDELATLTGSSKPRTVINVPNHLTERRETVLVREVAREEEKTNTSSNSNSTDNDSIFDKQVNELLGHLNDLYLKNVNPRPRKPLAASSSFPVLAPSASANSLGGSAGHVKGTIITHLHEHSKNITKLSSNQDGELFLSGSADGTVKVWKTRSILGEGYGAARSEDTWVPTDTGRQHVYAVGWNDQYICSATGDGSVRWADIGQGAARVVTQVKIPESEGAPVYLHCNGPMTVVRTHHGVLYGIDLRVGASEGPLKRHDIWRKKFQETHGFVTASTIDPWQQSWMVIGNNSKTKNLMLYDLRFREEVLRWESPHENVQPLAVWANPVSRQESPEVLVGFSLHGEVSSYELGAQPLRKRAFWTGGTPILSYSNTNDPRKQDLLVTRALCVCEKTGMIYTGDTRGAIRKWNSSRAIGCEVLSSPPKGRLAYRTIFEENDVSNTPSEPLVIYERSVLDTEAKENQKVVPLDSKPSTYHRTPITDMMLLNSELLVSSGYDGVIKIWK
uniref:non-specific serine/threonine protein kinase n=1 Tax=Caenorhabditis tropicalis TaxID=1561998 RepID=A0A1I7UCA5_9PELO